MNIFSKILSRTWRALLPVLVFFAILLTPFIFYTAYSVWVLGSTNSKWGDAWGNFSMIVGISIIFVGIQCVIMFLGNIIAVLISKEAFKHTIFYASLFSVAANAFIAVAGELEAFALFMFGIPITYVILVIISTLVEKRKNS